MRLRISPTLCEPSMVKTAVFEHRNDDTTFFVTADCLKKNIPERSNTLGEFECFRIAF